MGAAGMNGKSLGMDHSDPIEVRSRSARSSEEIAEEIQSLMEERTDLPQETREVILESLKGQGEEDAGGLDDYIKLLREEDAEFINMAVELSKSLDLPFYRMVMDYAKDVREEIANL